MSLTGSAASSESCSAVERSVAQCTGLLYYSETNTGPGARQLPTASYCILTLLDKAADTEQLGQNNAISGPHTP